jgi:hypothetical protein
MRDRGEVALWNIRNEAVLQFAVSNGAGGRPITDRAKVKKVSRYCDRFFDAMQSEAPFRSADEAVSALAPIAVWFIGWAARQFAIAVIRFLWERWHGVSSESQP